MQSFDKSSSYFLSAKHEQIRLWRTVFRTNCSVFAVSFACHASQNYFNNLAVRNFLPFTTDSCNVVELMQNRGTAKVKC